MRKIYLDNNATTPLDERVAAEIRELLSSSPLNPSSVHSFGQQAKQLLIRSRDTVAKALSVHPKEVIFTSGATESLNFLIKGFYLKNSSAHIISSRAEHPAVIETLQQLERQGASISYLPVGAMGRIEADQVESALKDKKAAILLVSAVNGVTGVKTDISSMADLAERYPVRLIVDGAQLMGKELFRIPPGVSGIAFSSHKFHGPVGAGIAILRKQTIPSLIAGGNQEEGRRAGTENLIGIVGMAKAAELLARELPAATEKMRSLRDHLIEGLREKIGQIVVHGEGEKICNTASISFPGVDGETLFIQLDRAGIAVSHGSACMSGGLKPSHVLLEMGIPSSLAQSSLRFSLSRMNNREEIDYTIKTVALLVENQKKNENFDR